MDVFLGSAKKALKHIEERKRAEDILGLWAAAWRGPCRKFTATESIHGAFLHFDQLIGDIWCKVFSFRAAPKHGFSVRGPDSDRARKSHKLRSNRLDTKALDSLFAAWSSYPEARPAGSAVELFLNEAHDDVWASFLCDALSCMDGNIAP